MQTWLVATAFLVTLASSGCTTLSFVGRDFSPISAEPTASIPNVDGIYEWIAEIRGANTYTLTGTITFEQDGPTVSIANTIHSNPANRDLVATADLEGNVLNMMMVPRNGDTDYTADVTMRFTSDGARFESEFDDTHDDFGPAYRCRRAHDAGCGR